MRPVIEISPSVVYAEKRTLLIINPVTQKELRVSLKPFFLSLQLPFTL